MLTIINQGTLPKDANLETETNVVVKNHPFVLIVESSECLTGKTVECKLIYDSEHCNLTNEVPVLRHPPLQYKGFRATVDTKLNVLTSHHEDTLFRILIKVYDLHTDNTEQILTNPLRVVSKQKQLQKFCSQRTFKKNASTKKRKLDDLPSNIGPSNEWSGSEEELQVKMRKALEEVIGCYSRLSPEYRKSSALSLAPLALQLQRECLALLPDSPTLP